MVQPFSSKAFQDDGSGHSGDNFTLSSPGSTGRSSTPRLVGSIVVASGILDRPPQCQSRARQTTTAEIVLAALCARSFAFRWGAGRRFDPSLLRAAVEACCMGCRTPRRRGISRANERASSGGTHDSCPAGFPVHRRNIRSLLRGHLCDVVCRQVAAQLPALASHSRPETE